MRSHNMFLLRNKKKLFGYSSNPYLIWSSDVKGSMDELEGKTYVLTL